MFVNPEETLKQLNLAKEMTAIDVGSGSGGWTLPLAKILEDGLVFAVDILEEPLSALQGKARHAGITNVRPVLADIELGLPKVASQSCDFALMTNVLFQIEDRPSAFKEIARVLKPGGQLLVVDWLPGPGFGPKEGRLPASEVKALASQANFDFTQELPVELYHYGLLFIKN